MNAVALMNLQTYSIVYDLNTILMTTLFIFVVYIFKLYKNLGAEYEKFLKNELHRVQEQNSNLVQAFTNTKEEQARILFDLGRIFCRQAKDESVEEKNAEEEESVEEKNAEEEESVEEKNAEEEQVYLKYDPTERKFREVQTEEKKHEKKSIELWAIDEELAKFTGWQPDSLVTFEDVFNFTNAFIKKHDILRGHDIIPSRNDDFKEFIDMSIPFDVSLLPVYLRMHLNPVPKFQLIGTCTDNLVFKPGHMDVVVGRRINGKIMPLTVQERDACRKIGWTVVGPS